MFLLQFDIQLVFLLLFPVSTFKSQQPFFPLELTDFIFWGGKSQLRQTGTWEELGQMQI